MIAFGIIVAVFGFIRLPGSKQSDGFTRVRINFAQYLAWGWRAGDQNTRAK